jgi:rod shape-determining protein MreC
MESPQRVGYLVLVVVLGHLLVISAQINAQPGGTVLETVTVGVFTQMQRWVTTTLGATGDLWTGYVGLRDLRQQNLALTENVAELELELQVQRALAQQARSLERLLRLQETTPLPTLGARVIASDATPYFRTLTIDRGRDDGVRPDMAVIAPAGVVGRVVAVSAGRAAQVQLLVDRNAAAGALVERTRASGLVVGTDTDGLLRMDYVSNLALEDVRIGDRVVTSGVDGIYPGGFLIGAVTKVEQGVGLYLAIYVDPVVEFSRIEDVLVVVDPSAAFTDAEGQ